MKYTPNEYTGKSLMMGKKKMMYGGMNRQKKMYGSKAKMMGGGMSMQKMMGGGRAMYGAGGGVTELEKRCSAMASVTESSLGRKLRDPKA